MSLACVSVGLKHEIWHKRLGHPNTLIYSHLMKCGFLGNKNLFQLSNLNFDYDTCKLGKSKTLSFTTHGNLVDKCFQIIHSDIWGITPFASHAQYKYFVTFIDDFSRYTWIYFFRSKSEVIITFKAFVAYIETQFSASIQILRSHKRGEYMSHDCQTFLQQKGIYLNVLVHILHSRMG